MDRCKGSMLDSDERCNLQRVTEDHCDWHQKKCVKLYKTYKKSSERAYSTSMPIINLIEWKESIRQIYNRYILFMRAWEDRKVHRDLCYMSEFWDRGHDIQFEIMNREIMKCEEAIYEIIDYVESEKEKETVIFSDKEEIEDEEYEDIVVQVKVKSKQYREDKDNEEKLIQNAIKERAEHDESVLKKIRWFVKHYNLETVPDSCICMTLVIIGFQYLTDLSIIKFDLPASSLKSLESFCLQYLSSDLDDIIREAIIHKDVFDKSINTLIGHKFDVTVYNNIDGRIKFDIHILGNIGITINYISTEGKYRCRTSECAGLPAKLATIEFMKNVREIGDGRFMQIESKHYKGSINEFYKRYSDIQPGESHGYGYSITHKGDKRGSNKRNVGNITPEYVANNYYHKNKESSIAYQLETKINQFLINSSK